MKLIFWRATSNQNKAEERKDEIDEDDKEDEENIRKARHSIVKKNKEMPEGKLFYSFIYS
jgi:hypothetical protein